MTAHAGSSKPVSPQTPLIDSILGRDQDPIMAPDASEKPRRRPSVAKGRVPPISEVVDEATTKGASFVEKAGKLAGVLAGTVEAVTGKPEHGDAMRAAAKIGSMAPAVVASVKEQLKPVGEAMKEFAEAAGRSGIKPTVRAPYDPGFAKRRPIHVGAGPKDKPQGRGTTAVEPGDGNAKKKEEAGK